MLFFPKSQNPVIDISALKFGPRDWAQAVISHESIHLLSNGKGLLNKSFVELTTLSGFYCAMSFLPCQAGWLSILICLKTCLWCVVKVSQAIPLHFARSARRTWTQLAASNNASNSQKEMWFLELEGSERLQGTERSQLWDRKDGSTQGRTTCLFLQLTLLSENYIVFVQFSPCTFFPYAILIGRKSAFEFQPNGRTFINSHFPANKEIQSQTDMYANT